LPAEESRILVDTDVVSYLGDRKGRHAEWGEVVRDRDAFISFVTVGEILAGGIKAGWGPRLTTLWESRLRAYTVVPWSIDIVREFAGLRARFGGRINDDDLWIAATALAESDGLPIATNDAHFDTIAAEFPIRLIRPSGGLGADHAAQDQASSI
jgi:predicted nucleic acid-binding protein